MKPSLGEYARRPAYRIQSTEFVMNSRSSLEAVWLITPLLFPIIDRANISKATLDVNSCGIDAVEGKATDAYKMKVTRMINQIVIMI